jgi:transcriptional regulator NrdR family protein
MLYQDKRWNVHCVKCESHKVELLRLERKKDKSNLRRYECLTCGKIFETRDYVTYAKCGMPQIQREYLYK